MAKGLSTNNKSASKINYYDYIDANPLYIHNHKRYFENTVRMINRIDDPIKEAEEMGKKYIAYLKGRETRLLNKLATNGRTGEENLAIIAHDIFIGANKNTNRTEEITNLLNDVFYMKKDEKISVGRGLKREKEQNNVFFKLSKTNTDTGKRDIYRIKLKPGGGLEKYDYKKSAQNLRNNENYDIIRAEMNKMVDSINEAIENNNILKEKLKKLVDSQAVDKEFDESGFLRKYLDNKVTSASSDEELLKFLVDKMGIYSNLKGYFTEATKIDYTTGLTEIFGESFHRDIGDEKRRDNIYKKPDIIITGKTINGNITPLTISRKALSGDVIKFHEGSIKSVSEMLATKNERLAKDYLYLNTNLGYYSDSQSDEVEKAKDIIKYIYKFMSYMFISGINQDIAEQKALYFVITDAENRTSFIPISKILSTIINNEEIKIDMRPALGTGGQGLMKLWNYKLDTTITKGYTRRSKKGLRYDTLSMDEKVTTQMNTMVRNLLGRGRRFEVNYTNEKLQTIISNGIIT